MSVHYARCTVLDVDIWRCIDHTIPHQYVSRIDYTFQYSTHGCMAAHSISTLCHKSTQLSVSAGCQTCLDTVPSKAANSASCGIQNQNMRILRCSFSLLPGSSGSFGQEYWNLSEQIASPHRQNHEGGCERMVPWAIPGAPQKFSSQAMSLLLME